jgi:hypothetical protein
MFYGALPRTPPKPFLKKGFWIPKNFNKNFLIKVLLIQTFLSKKVWWGVG